VSEWWIGLAPLSRRLERRETRAEGHQPGRKTQHRNPKSADGSRTDRILRHVTRENLLVIVMRADGRVIGVVVVVLRVMFVIEHHTDRFQIGMPGRRAPSDGEQDCEKCANTRHQFTGVANCRLSARAGFDRSGHSARRRSPRSGDPAPSAVNITVTRMLRKAAMVLDIERLDHVVGGDVKTDSLGGAYSFSEAGHSTVAQFAVICASRSRPAAACGVRKDYGDFRSSRCRRPIGSPNTCLM
jgi:hypothetical protein